MNGLTYFSNALEKANEYYNAGLDKANEHARPALTQALKKTNKYTPKIVQAQVNRGAKWVQTQRANYEHMKRAEAAWWTRTESLYDTPPADDVFGSDDESKVHEREEARLAREDQKRNPPQDKIFGDPVLVSHEPAQRPTPTAGLWHEIGEAEVKRVKRRAPGSAAVTTRTVTQPQYADASRAYQVRYVTEEKKQRDYIAARSEAEPTSFYDNDDEDDDDEYWDDDIRPYDSKTSVLATPEAIALLARTRLVDRAAPKPGQYLRPRTDSEVYRRWI